MSADMNPPRKPRALTPVTTHRAGTNPIDLAVIAAGVALCAGIGYVAWRTQVRGEKIEAVLPFLSNAPAAPARAPASGADSAPDLPEIHRDAPADGANAPAKQGDPAENDPDNTYFGRRERHGVPAPSAKPPR